ncbi:hypothetical protein Tco_0481181 [Tanacetum coccineum]
MTSIDGFFWLTTERDWYVHGIQHGNNKRSEEAKFYHEIRNLNDRIEIYTEPTAVNKTWRINSQWRPALPKGYKQQQLKRREWKKQHIKNVEKDLRETVNHELPMKSITKRDWYGRQTSRIDVGTDKKRWHNRLNKGRMDLEYSKQVHAELLLPKKPIDGGAQELNCVVLTDKP